MKKVLTILIIIIIVLVGGIYVYQTVKVPPSQTDNGLQVILPDQDSVSSSGLNFTKPGTNAASDCISEGRQYGAPETTKDLCCPGLIEQPSSESPSGTWGTCVKSKSETVNWKTYKDEEHGLEVKYPSDWKAGIPSDDGPLSSKVLLFCPPELVDADPGLVCKIKDNSPSMPGSEAPIIFSFVSGKLSLAKAGYEEVYNKMLSTLKFPQ